VMRLESYKHRNYSHGSRFVRLGFMGEGKVVDTGHSLCRHIIETWGYRYSYPLPDIQHRYLARSITKTITAMTTKAQENPSETHPTAGVYATTTRERNIKAEQ